VKRRGTTFVTTAAITLIVVVLLVVLLIELASSGSVKNQLGDKTFLAGNARDFAPQIAAQGPLLLPDLLGQDRPLYLQHLGSNFKTDWVAIQATLPGEATKCVIQWRAGAFHDPCTSITYPADGTGLIRYPVTVLPSNRINVDLRTPLPPTAPATSPTTASATSPTTAPSITSTTSPG
jgi:hypothetical protein